VKGNKIRLVLSNLILTTAYCAASGFEKAVVATAYRDGTTHVIFEPMDSIGRLVALLPKPGLDPTRFHGMFALKSTHRAWVTQAKRGEFDLTTCFVKATAW